jgi:virginiamycin B lyase
VRRCTAIAVASILAVGAALVLASPVQAQSYQTKVFPLPNQTYIHDVAPAPGGAIWWTAQSDGLLGILDPKTGANKFVKLGENSAPHGIITSKNGLAWIADGGQNAIVSYDPKTEKLATYKLPEDTGYTNLNTPTEDGDGNIWFTGQNGIHGKVDVKTGKVSVWKSPKGRGSYGITTTPDGNVWFVSLANSYLGQIDRKTGDVKVIEPPVRNSGVRRVWSDSKGDLWMSEWNTGQVARYSPASGQWSRWAIPGAARAQLYAVYVDSKDVVWVSNWTDNKTYSFDPKTEKFAAVPGSSSGSAIRQIAGAGGMVYLPESGNASIMVVNTGSQS